MPPPPGHTHGPCHRKLYAKFCIRLLNAVLYLCSSVNIMMYIWVIIAYVKNVTNRYIYLRNHGKYETNH